MDADRPKALHLHILGTWWPYSGLRHVHHPWRAFWWWKDLLSLGHAFNGQNLHHKTHHHAFMAPPLAPRQLTQANKSPRPVTEPHHPFSNLDPHHVFMTPIMTISLSFLFTHFEHSRPLLVPTWPTQSRGTTCRSTRTRTASCRTATQWRRRLVHCNSDRTPQDSTKLYPGHLGCQAWWGKARQICTRALKWRYLMCIYLNAYTYWYFTSKISVEQTKDHSTLPTQQDPNFAFAASFHAYSNFPETFIIWRSQ